MKELLLECITIAENKGVFMNELDFNKARLFIENQLNNEELDIIIDLLEHDDLSFTNDFQLMIDKLQKQKELLEYEM